MTTPDYDKLAAFWGGNKGMIDRITELETYSQKLESACKQAVAMLSQPVQNNENRPLTLEVIVAALNIIKTDCGAAKIVLTEALGA